MGIVKRSKAKGSDSNPSKGIKSGLNPVVDSIHQSRAMVSGVLDWVGMENIVIPIVFQQGQLNLTLSAQVDVGVSLDQSHARGIHMSRLYLTLQKHLAGQVISLKLLRSLLKKLIDGQNGLSNAGRLKIKLILPLERSALQSSTKGWNPYPVSIEIEGDQERQKITLGVEVLYSSTCPCSAALSQQILFDRLEKTDNWREVISGGLPATPHAQRSRATVHVDMSVHQKWDVLYLIDQVEDCLGTPVQTAVKREDEQAFAVLNAQNLMFCEDAARRIQSRIWDKYSHFAVKVEHFESLHAHNAVAYARK